MRLAKVYIYQEGLPVVGAPYAMARAKVEALDSTIERLVSGSGLSGFGETCPADRPISRSMHLALALRSSKWRRV